MLFVFIVQQKKKEDKQRQIKSISLLPHLLWSFQYIENLFKIGTSVELASQINLLA